MRARVTYVATPDGTAHIRAVVNGRPQSFEGDNLDEAGELKPLTRKQAEASTSKCRRCFP